MRRILLLLLLLPPVLTSPERVLGASDEALWGGRDFEKIPLPDAGCGSGLPYHYFFSEAPDPAEKRLTVYFEGGGQTSCGDAGNPCSPDEVRSSLRNLALLRSALTAGESVGDTGGVFRDRPENDAFVGPGHWLVLPYCTEDRHLGRRSDVQTYDMTRVADRDYRNTLVGDVESLLNDGFSVGEIARDYPGLEIAASLDEKGIWRVDELWLNVVHRGDGNVSAALEHAEKRLREIKAEFSADPGDGPFGRGSWRLVSVLANRRSRVVCARRPVDIGSSDRQSTREFIFGKIRRDGVGCDTRRCSRPAMGGMEWQAPV